MSTFFFFPMPLGGFRLGSATVEILPDLVLFNLKRTSYFSSGEKRFYGAVILFNSKRTSYFSSGEKRFIGAVLHMERQDIFISSATSTSGSL